MKKKICILLFIFLSALLAADTPLIRDIQARTSVKSAGNKVYITWKLPEKTNPPLTALILYRTTERISTFSQLSSTPPLASLSPDCTEYVDTLSDFKDYYYTIISMTDSIYDLVLLSFNSTVSGVHLIAKKADDKEKTKKEEYETIYPEGKLRKTPLPYLDILEGSNAEALVTNTTAEAAMNTLSSLSLNNKEKLRPYIFEEDLISPDAGDDYLLYEILKNFFVQKNYKMTIEKLNQLIGTNINEDTLNRAYFYLGEAQYFSENYEDAVRSFVKVQHIYKTLSKRWLDSALDKI